jgi:transcriptional regulator with XRE-family HTH domain
MGIAFGHAIWHGQAMLGELLNELIAAGYTQRRIAQESGLDQTTISRLINGKRGTRPTYETVLAIRGLHGRVKGEPSAPREAA